MGASETVFFSHDNRNAAGLSAEPQALTIKSLLVFSNSLNNFEKQILLLCPHQTKQL
jgi:hypothetical protein